MNGPSSGVTGLIFTFGTQPRSAMVPGLVMETEPAMREPARPEAGKIARVQATMTAARPGAGLFGIKA